MKILVTGASGFIGSHVLSVIEGMGYEVYATRLSNVAKTKKNQEIEWIELDILNLDAVSSMMSRVRPDLLIHLAWNVESGKYSTSPENLLWAYATLNLVKQFQSNGGQRVVVAGSCAEYSWNYGLCDEAQTPLLPSTVYGSCKDIARRLIYDFHNKQEIIFTWARIFYPYGPGEYRGRLIPQIILSFLENKELKTSLNKHYRDYIHARDVATALVHLVLNSKNSDCFNICSGSLIQVSNVIAECKKHVTKSPAIYLGGKSLKVIEPNLVGGINSKLLATGWTPKISFSDGIEEYIKYLSNLPTGS